MATPLSRPSPEPQDLTLRNLRALKKTFVMFVARVTAFESELAKLTNRVGIIEQETFPLPGELEGVRTTAVKQERKPY